jgi:hypothetical protein
MPKGRSSSFVSAPTLRAIPKTSTAEPSAGSTGRKSARASSPALSPAAGPTESGIAATSTAMSTISVASATPHVPTVNASTTDTTRFAAAPMISSLAISRWRPRAIRYWVSIQKRLVDEQDEREQRQDGGRLRVPSPTQAWIRFDGDHEQRQCKHERGAEPPRRPDSSSRRCRACSPRPRTRRRPGRARGHDAGQAEHELEEPRRDRVERRSVAPSTIPTTTTSVEKTTLFATWTRKLLQLTPTSSRPARVNVLALQPQLRQLATQPDEREP